MIEVINRELIVPREEYNIGTNYDERSEVRQFHMKRVTSGGIDLAHLSFSLDIRYYNDATDTALLDKEVTDKDIILTLNIVNSMLQVPGTVAIQIRALSADGTVKWTSYIGALFVEDAINFPASYTGGISELERLETEWAEIYANEQERKAAETARANAETERAEAEEGRNTAENERVAAEEERVAADSRRAEEFRQAIETAENTLSRGYQNALDDAEVDLKRQYDNELEDAKTALTNAVQAIANDAADSASDAADSADAAEQYAYNASQSAGAAALSEQNAAASKNILEFYVNYVVPEFVIANNRLYLRDTATQNFIVANNRLYIQNPA